MPKSKKPKIHVITLGISQGVIDEWKMKTGLVRMVGGVGNYADAVLSSIVEAIENKQKELKLSLKTEG